MSKNKSRKPQQNFGGPSKKTNLLPNQTQKTISEINGLKQVMVNFEKQVNAKLAEIGAKMRKHDLDIGSAFDLIDANMNVKKMKAPSGAKFFEFCQKTMNMPYTDMELDVKFNALLQYMENTFAWNDQLHSQFVFQAFDRRNNLKRIPEGMPVQDGHLALIAWLVEENGQPLAGQKTPAIYTVGSNDLLIDAELKEMKRGEQKEIEKTFPVDHHIALLRGKTVNVKLSVYDFKLKADQIKTPADLAKMPQEEKKKIWREQYKAKEIE